MKKCLFAKLVATKVVGSKENLCSALSISTQKFENILSRSDQDRFRLKSIFKKNGVDVREVYCPSWDVRVLLRRFNKRFFADPKVMTWPYFLYGCIPNNSGSLDGRDYISCAAVHSEARALIKIDVANFFPSITEDWVRTVFSKTLLFPAALAKDLAKINCFNGALVQGSPCASYIAGAIFGLNEGKLVNRLEAKGYRYTRYVDDITISSTRRGESFALATRLIDDLLSQHDLERNISKTCILRSGTSPILVHGIKVGGGKISIPREEFKAIRASVHTLEKYALSLDFRSSLHYRRMYMRCVGLVGKLARTKDRRSQQYFDRLRHVRPSSTQEDIDLCTRWVSEIERKSISRSNYFFHIRQANKTWSRLTILGWTYPLEARALKNRLRKHKASYADVKI